MIMNDIVNFKNNSALILVKGPSHCGQVMPYGDIDLAQHWFR